MSETLEKKEVHGSRKAATGPMFNTYSMDEKSAREGEGVRWRLRKKKKTVEIVYT